MIMNMRPVEATVVIRGDKKVDTVDTVDTYEDGRRDYRNEVISLVERMTEKSIKRCGESKESNIKAVGYIEAVEEIADFLEENC